MGYSWERIKSFTPWVTHGIQLRAFIERKMLQSRYLLLGKIYIICLKRDNPAIPQGIDYGSHLDSLKVTKGVPLLMILILTSVPFSLTTVRLSILSLTDCY